jgi:peptidoglycan/LPS O-acetylase OafA/YrhL
MSQPQIKTLPPLFSVVLDVLRLVAALGVFVSHLCRPEYSSALVRYQSWVGDGHEWVVVFLVISGFVVCHSTLTRVTTAGQYVFKRLSRLWSVLIPALVLTAVVEVLLRAWSGIPSDGANSSLMTAVRSGMTALFLNEMWFFSAAPALNKPLWSISYEFWYYAAFAAVVFPQRGWAKLAWSTGVLALAGPKIALLIPCWGAGVVVWWVTRWGRTPHSLGGRWLVYLIGLMAFGASGWLFLKGWRLPDDVDGSRLWFSRWFVSDWVIAGLLAALLIAVHVATSQKPSGGTQGVARGLRLAADQTFAIYAFHFPLLAAASALLGAYSAQALPALLGGGVVLLLTLVGGQLCRGWHQTMLKSMPRAPEPVLG